MVYNRITAYSGICSGFSACNPSIWKNNSSNSDMVFLANIQEKNIRRIEICIAGCIITIFMMYSIDISYQGTILLNELLLLYVFWLARMHM